MLARILFAPSGDDSPPLPDDLAVLVYNNRTGGLAYLGAIDQANAPEAQPGERRIYARDSSGAIVSTLWLKGDGTLELNGAADFAVRFNALQTKLSALEAQLLAHTHPGVQSGGASTGPRRCPSPRSVRRCGRPRGRRASA